MNLVDFAYKNFWLIKQLVGRSNFYEEKVFMNNKKVLSAVIMLVGFLGTLLGIIALDDKLQRIIFSIIFAIFSTIGFISYISQFINIWEIWSNLARIKQLGIKRIYVEEISKRISNQMSTANRIRIMVLSGIGLIRSTKKEIIHALVNEKAFIQVLVCEPNTIFIIDTDEMEDREPSSHISTEIINVINLLNEYIKEAQTVKRKEEVGEIKIGFFSTQLRSSLVICDNDYGWLTFNLPPERAVQSVSLELIDSDNGLLPRSIKHFDRVWEILEENDKVLSFPFDKLPKPT
jgi:hypothetical protein